MAVYDEFEGKRWIAFHTSADLKNWQFQSRIESYFECPEIFELPVDGDKGKTKWVVYAADGNYAVGTFDGKTFTPDHPGKHRHNWGNCFYASQTFNNIPPEDGRRIQIAWGRMGHPSMPFNQMMDFPVELTLRTTEEGIRMFAIPVKEIEKLHAKQHAWRDKELKEGENLLAGITGDLFHIRAELAVGDAAELVFVLRGTPVVYNAKAQQLDCKGCKAPLKPVEGKVRLEILVDRTSIEVFGNDGRIYMPVGVIPPEENRSLEVFARGGVAKLNLLEVCELRSAWQ
jgi:fructan beta-fructosidase